MSGKEKSVESLLDKDLKILIKNYQAKQATGLPYFQLLLIEANRRNCAELDIEKSIAATTEAARAGRFITYGAIAEANGCVWNKVRHPMNMHLQKVLEYCHARSIPLLPSIVVNQQAFQSGELQETALIGFVRGVEVATGNRIANPTQFLREEQARVFSWAANLSA